MEFVLFILFAAAVYASPLIWRNPTCKLLYRLSLILSPVIATGLGYYFTFRFRLKTANTELFGFPFPQYAFQRSGPDQPWLDFPGLGPYIALPFNIFSFLVFYILCIWLVLILHKKISIHRPNP